MGTGAKKVPELVEGTQVAPSALCMVAEGEEESDAVMWLFME